MIHEHMEDLILGAADALRTGNIVFMHDSSSRENEVDMVASAHMCTPDMISMMRENAGGLICSAIGNDVAASLHLPFMHEILELSGEKYPYLASMIETRTPYGGRPAFSITVNHRDTYTGVSDAERCMTVRQIGRVAKLVSEGKDANSEFYSKLKSPGHVPLLIEARNSLAERRGHTELSISLSRIAGLPPATVVCEMLDSDTHQSMSLENARRIARELDLPIIEGELLH
jgi:3,4-dihydroxy 2-butanone 4-phosphate synthase